MAMTGKGCLTSFFRFCLIFLDSICLLSTTFIKQRENGGVNIILRVTPMIQFELVGWTWVNFPLKSST